MKKAEHVACSKPWAVLLTLDAGTRKGPCQVKCQKLLRTRIASACFEGLSYMSHRVSSQVPGAFWTGLFGGITRTETRGPCSCNHAFHLFGAVRFYTCPPVHLCVRKPICLLTCHPIFKNSLSIHVALLSVVCLPTYPSIHPDFA